MFRAIFFMQIHDIFKYNFIITCLFSLQLLFPASNPPIVAGYIFTPLYLVSLLKCRTPGFDPCMGRSPGKGNSYPLQYSCVENSMDRGAWWATNPWAHKELDMTQ